VQYNEYYPFGMQTASSWTRENAVKNDFLYNGGTELNTTSGLYDLHFRNYDPVLGRMWGVDPAAAKYSSVSPYNYAFNDPVGLNDPSGADPYANTINHSAQVTGRATFYTYDDRVDYHYRGAFHTGGSASALKHGYRGPGSGHHWVDWETGPYSMYTPLLQGMMTEGELVPEWSYTVYVYPDGTESIPLNLRLVGFQFRQAQQEWTPDYVNKTFGRAFDRGEVGTATFIPLNRQNSPEQVQNELEKKLGKIMDDPKYYLIPDSADPLTALRPIKYQIEVNGNLTEKFFVDPSTVNDTRLYGNPGTLTPTGAPTPITYRVSDGTKLIRINVIVYFQKPFQL
jgi:RHS repeat-associated protein